jgi:hypothetical protein
MAGAVLLGGATPAVAAPGDNGDVKIQPMGKRFDDRRNYPKVCDFFIAAFNFDEGQSVTWTIVPHPAGRPGDTRSGSLTLPTGTGYTMPIPRMSDGQYKLTWKITGGAGAGKHKVFKVDCANMTPPPMPPDGKPPHGGVPAGGGGLAAPDFSSVGGAAAVGLVAFGGVMYLRRRRNGAA